MHVTFGLCLDARQGPSTDDSFNKPVVGRLGFLSLLETYLGLAAPEVAKTRRITAYLGLLDAADTGKRFYSESLKVDRIGTASGLLAWRDEWRECGWSGASQPNDPPRIQDMAAVEAFAPATLPPGEAERLAEVAEALTANPKLPIETVTLVDELDHFPWCWQQVLKLLPAVTVALPTPQGSGQLRTVQECAAEAITTGTLKEKLPPITDGSVRFVRSLSSATAQHWLSAYQHASPDDRLVLAEENGPGLDAVLSATGAAGCGFQSPSSLRPALQALGLAIDLCWAPLDVGRLVDFLTHPVGPFKRSARTKLAEAVAEQPGVGGELWNAVKQSIGEQGEDGPAVVAEVEYWLEGERWPRDDGIPIVKLLDRVEQMRERLRKRLSEPEVGPAIYAPAHRQCAAVYEGLRQLQEQGQGVVLPREVEQLVSHATPGGSTSPSSEAQAGCMRAASVAGACVESAEELIWWMLAAPLLKQQRPWSTSEVNALANLGVQLPDPARELALQAQHWLRPLLAARKRFVLVLPPPGHEVHPMRQLLEQMCPDLEASAANLDAEVGGQLVGSLSAVVGKQPFPSNPAVLQLPSPVPLPQKPQSYSSLSELFNNPALFALKRVANLRPTSVLAIEEDNRLLGALAHRLFELLFKHPGVLALSTQQVTAWFTPAADELLRTEGAILLMQGAGVSAQRFRATCERAILVLLDHLRSAHAVGVRTEVEYQGTFAKAPLVGKVDLVVDLPGDVCAAIDVKWRGDTRYAGMLRAGTHLQLALYSELIREQTGTAPVGLGYFILEGGALYVDRPDVFPLAQVRCPSQGATGTKLATDLVGLAANSHAWRADQLKNGQVAVLLDKAEAADQGPPGTLPVEGALPWDHDHLVLMGGWE
jgi:hypothetical protein